MTKIEAFFRDFRKGVKADLWEPYLTPEMHIRFHAPHDYGLVMCPVTLVEFVRFEKFYTSEEVFKTRTDKELLQHGFDVVTAADTDDIDGLSYGLGEIRQRMLDITGLDG